MRPKTLILSGPTASGKSALAIDLIRQFAPDNAEIINGDSIQVYRHFDIGSAKPHAQELSKIPHHLIDCVDPEVNFTAGDFCRGVKVAISEIHSKNKIALIVGGSPFYLRALLFGMWDLPPTDPAIQAQVESKLELQSNLELWTELKELDLAASKKISQNDRYRLVRALEVFYLSGKTPSQLASERPSEPSPDFNLWIIDREPNDLLSRVDRRTTQMLESGLVDEVRSLQSRYSHAPALRSVGYRQVCDYLNGIQPEGRLLAPGTLGLHDEIVLATRQLIKKQRTWFRSQDFARKFLLPDAQSQIEEAFQTWVDSELDPCKSIP